MGCLFSKKQYNDSPIRYIENFNLSNNEYEIITENNSSTQNPYYYQSL